METTTMSVINARRQQAADRLGIEIGKVHTHRLELKQLRENGLLIDLDIHGISMFAVQTSFAELGIAGDDVRVKRMRAGRKDLFPKLGKKLRSLEARARQNLERHSHVVPAFGNYKWLPWTAYESYRETHDQILTELDAVKQEAISKWDEVYEENRKFFEAAAERAWKGLLGQYAPGDEVMIATANGPAFNSRTEHDRFIEYLVQKGLGRMPTPEEIESLVRIDYTTSVLYADSEVMAEDVAQAALQAQMAEEQAKQAEAEHEVWEMQLAENQEHAKIEAFKQAEMAHAREQLAAMGSPLQDALDGLRANLYDAVQSLLEGLRTNDGFRGRSSTKAAELYNYWKKLNGGLLQDDTLDAVLEDLDAEMKLYKSTADRKMKVAQIGEITSALTEIATLTVESARKMRNQSSRASALEL
jgi:hypothetical protein